MAINAQTDTKEETRQIKLNILLRDFLEIANRQDLPLKEKIEKVLILANGFLDTDTAVIGEIIGNTYQISYAVSSESHITAGEVFNIHNTFCLRTCQTDGLFTIPDCTTEEYNALPCREYFKYKSYAGISINVGDRVYGTLHFATHSKKKHFFESANELIKIIAQWVSHEIYKNQNYLTLKNAEAALRLENKDLTRKCQDIKELASFVSHDMKHPLRAINGFLELLEMNLGEDITESAKELIQEALSASDYMDMLLDDLLSYLETDKSGAKTEKIDTNTVIARVIKQAELRFSAADRDIEITYDELPTIYYGAALFERIIANLVDNAVKYCDENPVKIHISSGRDDDHWIFSVQDNGIGVPESHRTKIFGMFERLQTKEDAEGTGIGLAICRKVVESYGGRIWVEPISHIDTEENQGSIFKFSVPINSHGYEIRDVT